MADAESGGLRPPLAGNALAGNVRVRVDEPHALAASPEAPVVADPQMAAAAAGVGRENLPEQVRAQLRTVAQQLAQRQQQIDRREAQFNAQLALVDKEARAGRFGLTRRNSGWPSSGKNSSSSCVSWPTSKPN